MVSGEAQDVQGVWKGYGKDDDVCKDSACKARLWNGEGGNENDNNGGSAQWLQCMDEEQRGDKGGEGGGAKASILFCVNIAGLKIFHHFLVLKKIFCKTILEISFSIIFNDLYN